MAPEYLDAARNAGIQGMVTVATDGDETGTPRSMRVVKTPGYGLEEKPLNALRNGASVRDGRMASPYPLA